MRKIYLLLITLLVCGTMSALSISVQRNADCNIYESGKKISFPVTLKDKDGVKGILKAEIIDYFNNKVWQNESEITGPNIELTVDQELPTGYYELNLTAVNAGGEELKKHKVCFGVAGFVNRTAQESRDGGYRFGMKVWTSGNIWWRKGTKWDAPKMTEVCAKLGLSWTRIQLNQTGEADCIGWMDQYPINVVMKVETFPPEFYNEAKYGPREKIKAWSKGTLPMKEPYQQWIKEWVAKVPAGQNVFEIWNEPWQWKTLSAEDFALLCNWCVEAIRAVRPNAVIGPNIHGSINDYDKRFIAAGGFNGMNMIAIHPYCSRTTEYRGFRRQMRSYAEYVEKATGIKLDFYSTEYGWSTAPEGKRVVDEAQQARNTVRESLELYAGDVKTLIPHTMGQREQNPKEREDYFGFFRLNGEPKPAIMAFAACARMIDGGKFIGEQWFGPGIGAMRFEKDNRQLLALWTEDTDKKLELDLGIPQVTVIDIMGREKTVQAVNGKLPLELSGDVIYLVGVPPAPANQLIAPDAPLRYDRWHDRPVEATIKSGTGFPATTGAPALELKNDKAKDIGLDLYCNWNEKSFAITAVIKDKTIVLKNPEGQGFGDRLVLDLDFRLDRQTDKGSIYNTQLIFEPSDGETPAKLTATQANWLKPREFTTDQPADGVRWTFSNDDKTWTIQAEFSADIFGKKSFAAGDAASCRVILFDRDSKSVDEWKRDKYNKRLQNAKDRDVPFNTLPLIKLEK